MIRYITFSMSLSCLLYVYLGYPLVLYLVSRIRKASVKKLEIYPRVAIFISAHNEEQVIARKLENTLRLDYPAHLLRIIVISDGSSDRTDEIVRRHANDRVLLVRLNDRRGKSAGLNEAIRSGNDEIILMTDANAMLQQHSLKALVKSFSDPRVGFVTGWTRYGGDTKMGVTSSAGLYTRFETSLKTMESLIGSCVGADGAIFGIRKVLYEPLQDHDINDFVLALKIVKKGYRGIFETRALCEEEASYNPGHEFRRQVRIANRTLRAIFSHYDLLNPFRHGWFAVQLLSHKFLRFLSPYFLLALFFSTLSLRENGAPYQTLLGIQGLLYTCAIVGFFLASNKSPHRVISLCTHFAMINVAYLGGWLKVLAGSLDTTWDRQNRERITYR